MLLAVAEGLRGVEATKDYLRETPCSRLGSPDCRLANHREGPANIAGRGVGRVDPVGGNAHALEHLVEVGVTIANANAHDDVLLGLEQAFHHLAQAGRSNRPGVVTTIGDDGRDRTGSNATLFELGHLGRNGGEGDLRFPIERRAACRVEVVLIELDGPIQHAVRVQHAVVEKTAADQDGIGLLGAVEGIDDTVGTITHRLGIARDHADGTAVVDDLGDQRHLGSGDVVDVDVAKPRHDGRAEGVCRQHHGRGGGIVEPGITEQGIEVYAVGHGDTFLSLF